MTYLFNGFQQHLIYQDHPFQVREGDFHIETIDISATSRLDWKMPPTELPIVWKLHYGLAYEEPLVRTLELAMHDLAQRGGEKTLGVLLGSHKLCELDEATLELYRRLSAHLPDVWHLFLHLDGSCLSCSEQLQHGVARNFAPFQVIYRGELIRRFPYSAPYIGDKSTTPLGSWNEASTLPEKRLTKALLLPEGPEGWEQVANCLSDDVRLIRESRLIYEWEGVDQLFVIAQALSFKGRRSVAGFEATGGEVIRVTQGA